MNGVNLLFPAGERFFVRSVRHYMAEGRGLTREQREALERDVKGFFGQEGRHAQVHERFFDTLRAQGYEIDEAILEPFERFAFQRLERLAPPALRLAITVAEEHFTAILAGDALTGGMVELAHPAMRRLLEWHAVEELEHKAVAFDVLQAVNPSYLLRVAGITVGALLLAGFWLNATQTLLAQDGKSLRALLNLRRDVKDRGRKPLEPIFLRVFVRGILAYLRPGFHPNDKDHSELIAATLARLEAEGVIERDSNDVAEAAQ